MSDTTDYLQRYIRAIDRRTNVCINNARAALSSLEDTVKSGDLSNWNFSFEPLIKAVERRDALIYLLSMVRTIENLEEKENDGGE